MKRIYKQRKGSLKIAPFCSGLLAFPPPRRQTSFCLLLTIIIGIVLSLNGCKKFVQVPSPVTQLVNASTFDNDASATSAVTYIYTQMFKNNESFDVASQNGSASDELISYQSGVYYQLYVNAMTAPGGPYGEWQNAYSYIYQANAVIAGLDQYSGTSPGVKNQLLGEAYFIRAFWDFYLTDTYGSVPLALTTDYTVTSRLSRTTRIQVLQQVIDDLQTAKGLLNNHYVDASDTTITTDRVRPTKSVATALLARAYLYLGDYSNNSADYTKADSAATTLISNSTYSLCSNLSGPNSPFLINSSEAIWQIATPRPAIVDTYDGAGFILLASPLGTSNTSISPQLLSAFEPGDQRKVNWISSIAEDGTTYYFPYKYKNSAVNGYLGTECTTVFRLAEQYLIRAEGKAELGDPTAVNDLNAIRNRAGLPNYTGAMDKASLLVAIMHERQVELFTEWGHRWYDLERAAANSSEMVNINTVMGSPSNVCQAKGGIWSTYKALYPIPLSDIQKDGNLTQNAGY